ncbi:MAG: SdrD B-like domain-containing protein, partial [Chloroflexota bacterium]
ATVQLWTILETSPPDESGDSDVDGTNSAMPDGVHVASTTSDRNGHYQFLNLTPNQTYQVVFVQPSDRVFTGQNLGNDDALDSDPDPSTGIVSEIGLLPGERVETIFAGVTPLTSPATLNGRVVSSPQQEASFGVTGIVVRLWTNATTTNDGTITVDQLANVTVTDGEGGYVFHHLDPALPYVIELVPPSGYQFKMQPTRQRTAQPGADQPDAAQPGADQPVVLQSLDSPSALTGPISLQPSTQTTLPDALLTPQLFAVQESTVQGDSSILFSQTLNGQQPYTSDTALRIHPDETLIFEYTLTNLHLITTTVFNTNLAIIWNAVGVSGVNENDALVDLTAQCGLPQVILPGNYHTCTFTLDADDFPEGRALQAMPSIIISAGEAAGEPTAQPLSPQPNSMWYQTDRSYAMITGVVWEDINQNGLHDNLDTGQQEPRLSGIVVELYDAQGDADNPLATTTTATDGTYQFPGLLPGQRYTVQVRLPNGETYFTQQVARDDNDSDDTLTVGSHVHVANGRSDVVVMSITNPRAAVNAGIIGLLHEQPSTVGNYVWLDQNGNGLQDANEPGLANVQVELLNPDGSIQTSTATDANGHYLLTPLNPGIYQLRLTPPRPYLLTRSSPTPNYYRSYDSDLAGDITKPITVTVQGTTFDSLQTLTSAIAETTLFELGVNETYLDIDAGFTQPVVFGDYVWMDENEDGIQQSDEPAAAGVGVTLFARNTMTPLAHLVTEETGYYAFAQLLPGEYDVQFTPPEGYQLTTPNVGVSDLLDSDANVATGLGTVELFLNDSESVSNFAIDAGIIPQRIPQHRLFLPVITR